MCLCYASDHKLGACAISTLNDTGMGNKIYIQAIPFMFYPIAAIICRLLLALGIMPKIGNMKKAYERVNSGGDTLDEISKSTSEEIPVSNEKGNPWFS